MNDPLIPVRITPGEGSSMRIEWRDGSVSDLSFETLRRACPCATCKELHNQRDQPVLDDRLQIRLQSSDAPPADPILVQVDWVGNYAVRLVWADGHSTGIYHYEYLRGLGSEPSADGE